MLTTCPTPEGLLDDVGRVLRPDEGRGVSVPLRQIAFDVADQGEDRIERAAPYRFAREDAEPGLDEVEPRGAFRREVKVHPRMPGQPGLHGRCRMGGGVVQDDVEVLTAVAASQP